MTTATVSTDTIADTITSWFQAASTTSDDTAFMVAKQALWDLDTELDLSYQAKQRATAPEGFYGELRGWFTDKASRVLSANPSLTDPQTQARLVKVADYFRDHLDLDESFMGLAA